MVQKIVKDISNHLNLLLSLQVIIDLPSALLSHERLPSLSFNPLQIRHDSLDAVAEGIEPLVHLLLLARVKAHMRGSLAAVMWLVVRVLLVSSARLAMVLHLRMAWVLLA